MKPASLKAQGFVISTSSILGLVVMMATYLAVENSLLVNFVSFLVTTFHTAIIANFVRQVSKRRYVSGRPVLGISSALTIVFATVFMTYSQFTPYRIEGISGDAAGLFGEVWDTKNQTVYGYPHPFLRNFDSPMEPYGKTIMHWDGLFMLVFLFMGFVFVFTALIAIFARYLERRQPQSGRYFKAAA